MEATMEADPTQAYNQDDATGFIRLALNRPASRHLHWAPAVAASTRYKQVLVLR